MSNIKWVTRCQEFLKVRWMTCGTLTPVFSDLGEGLPANRYKRQCYLVAALGSVVEHRPVRPGYHFSYGAHEARCPVGVTKAWVRSCGHGWKTQSTYCPAG